MSNDMLLLNELRIVRAQNSAKRKKKKPLRSAFPIFVVEARVAEVNQPQVVNLYKPSVTPEKLCPWQVYVEY